MHMIVQWDDKYRIGIDEIDGHHMKLFQLLNRSYFLLLQEDNGEELMRLLDELIDYTRYHFAAEEDLMQGYCYRNIDQHMIEHFNFVNRVLSFKREIQEGRKHLSVEVFDFIKNWLFDHILKTDSEMGKSIRFKQSS